MIDMPTLLNLMREAHQPILDHLTRVEGRLGQIDDRMAKYATSEDLSRLERNINERLSRTEAMLSNVYVSKDVYEARHSQLIERDAQIDQSLRQERGEREQSFKDIRTLIAEEERFSAKERITQILAIIAIVVAILAPVFAHLLDHIIWH